MTGDAARVALITGVSRRVGICAGIARQTIASAGGWQRSAVRRHLSGVRQPHARG